MASAADLLARAGVRTVPKTSLSTWGAGPPGLQPAPTPSAPPRPSVDEPILTPLDQIRAAGGTIDQMQPDQPADDRPWFKKALGTVLGNKGVQTALKPLELLALPGNAVTSTIKEGLDVVGEPVGKAIEDVLAPIGLASRTDWENKNPYDGEFDAGDLWSNIKDHKGFGELLVQPATEADGSDRGIWTRRIAGFAGDVASDPLSYLTLGATTTVGKAGRRNLAAAAYSAGMDEDAIARAARGAQFLKPAEREALGLERAGLQVGSLLKPGGAGVRIPGTEKLATGVGQTLGRAREGIARVRPWQSINQNPKTIEEAAAVLSGQPGRLTMTQAAAVVAYDEVLRGTQKSFVEPAAREAHALVGKWDEPTAQLMTHAVEAGAPEGAELAAFLRKLRTSVEGDIDMGDLGDNYMPHMWTDEGRALLDGESELGRELNKIVSGSKGSGVVDTRRLRAGTYTINGQKVTFKTGTIDDINRTLAKEFPELNGVKLLKDDARELVSQYINSLGNNVAKVKGFQHLVSRPGGGGVAANLDDVADDVVKEFANTTANKASAAAAKDVLKVRGEAYKAEQAAAKKSAAEIQKVLTTQLKELLDAADVVEGPLRKTIETITAQGKDLAATRKALGSQITAMKKQGAAQLKKLEDEFFALEKQMEAEQILLAAAKDPATRLSTFNKLAARKVELQAKIDAGKAAQRKVDQLTEQLATAVAASQKLRVVADDPDEIAELRKLMMATEKAATPTVEAGIKAEGQLAALPVNAQEALGAKGLESSLAAAGARQEGVAASAEQVEAAMKQLDSAAAAEYEKLDAAKAAIDMRMKMAKAGADSATAEVKALKGKIAAAEKINPSRDLPKVARDLDAIVKDLKDAPEMAPVLALQAQYADSVARLASMKKESELANLMLKEARSGKLHRTYAIEAKKGWTEVMSGLLPDGQRIAIQDEVDRALQRVIEAEANEVGKAIDKMTQFFKAYATATPGFHVRNAIGAVYSNIADGATPGDHTRALAAWASYKKDPMQYMARIQKDDPKLYDAFVATFGSGAGGQYVSEELGKGTSFVMNNRLLKAMHKVGADIEGPARLALAIRATVHDGQSMQSALQRVSRIHVDYSQLSRFDAQMKRVVPFWMFMSRNLPTQVAQMFAKPRFYSMYGRLHDSAWQANGFEGLPEYLEDQFALPLGQDASGNERVLKPDLPFLNFQQDVATFDPRNPLRLLSNTNPIFSAPLEAAAGQDFYYGSKLEGSERITDPLSSIFSPIAQAQRLTASGKYEGKGKEKWTNFLGAPYQEVNQEQIAREMMFRARDGG